MEGIGGTGLAGWFMPGVRRAFSCGGGTVGAGHSAKTSPSRLCLTHHWHQP